MAEAVPRIATGADECSGRSLLRQASARRQRALHDAKAGAG